jgi:putative DNA primase/helicase
LIRSLLIWLGEADPCSGMDEARENDPKRQKAIQALYQLHRLFNDQEFTTSKIIERVNEILPYNSVFDKKFYNQHEKQIEKLTNTAHYNPVYQHNACRMAILQVAATHNGREVSAERLGRFLSAYRDRIVGGYEVHRVGVSHKAVKWQIIRHDDAEDYEEAIIQSTEVQLPEIVTKLGKVG